MAHIGDNIGPFELVERLRRGRRTALYRAVRRRPVQRGPNEVALRVAESAQPEVEAEVVEALRAEYEALRLLEDDRIPRPVALYTGHGALALEWVTGASLADTLRLVQMGRLDLDASTSLDILVELAYALRHAHAIVRDEGRIVHGTLAPDVVWLTPQGGVVLQGLGDPDPGHEWPLAPEQQRGVQEPRTDQWLLGALGIELLRHAPELLEAARGAPIEQVFALLQSRWPAATRVLARALSEDPSARYDAEERFIRDLLTVARGVGGVSRRAEVGARTLQLASSLQAPDARTSAPVAAASQPPAPATRPSAASVANTLPVPNRAAPSRMGVPPAVQGAPTAAHVPYAHTEAPAARIPDPANLVPSTWPRHDARPDARPLAGVAAADAESTTIERAPGGWRPNDDEPTEVGDPDWESTGEFGTPPSHPSDPKQPARAAAIAAPGRAGPPAVVPLSRIDLQRTGVAALPAGGSSPPADDPPLSAPTMSIPPAFRVPHAGEERAETAAPGPRLGTGPAPDADEGIENTWLGAGFEADEHAHGPVPVTGEGAAADLAPARLAPADLEPSASDPAATDPDDQPLEPRAPRAERPPAPADPVPDQWVYNAIGAFALVAALVTLWAALS